MDIKKYLSRINWVYFIVIVIFSFYLINKEGWESYLNYLLFFIALFVPIFVFILAYKIIRQVIVNEDISKSDINIFILLIIVTLATYFIGLEKAQRVVLLVVDTIVCFFIFLIMLYMSRKRKT